MKLMPRWIKPLEWGIMHATDVRLVLNMVEEALAEAIEFFVTVKPDASPHSPRVWCPSGLPEQEGR